MRRASVGSANGDFVAEGVRYRQRDLMAQNARWNLKKTVLVLLTMPMRRVK